MSRIISKKHQGREIIIGELSVKKNHCPKNPNEVVLVFKVFHGAPGCEEDLFVFHYNKLIKDWMLNPYKSLTSLNMLSNSRLLDEVYCKINPNESLNIQEFTDLLEKHFDIFIEANAPTEVHKLSLISRIKKLFRRKEI